MDTRGSGNGNAPDCTAQSIPAVGCTSARHIRAHRSSPGQRNPLQVFGYGGPRKGPRYEAMRVQQWIAWITGQRDWVQVKVVARSVGVPSDRLLRLLRRHGIPRRYDQRNRALVSLSSLPQIIDTLLLSPQSSTTRSGNGRRSARVNGTFGQRSHVDSRV